MIHRYITVFLFMLLLTSCGGESPEPVAVGSGNTKPLIIASNYPLYFIANEIAGDSAGVIFPSMAGDPANWKPGPEDISQMQSADLVILNGAGYENWLNWVSLPEGILLDTSAGLSDRLIPLEEESLHKHGPEGEHSHQGLAFTIWLDPVLAMEQARVIEQAVSELAPGKKDEHRSRLADLEARLAGLDESFRLSFKALTDDPIVFSHPVYQYLEARYGLNGVSVHWEPGEGPGIRAWIDFQDILRQHPAKLMVWEDDPGEQIADQLGKLDVLPITFHTASNTPPSGDYFDVMKANLERLILK